MMYNYNPYYNPAYPMPQQMPQQIQQQIPPIDEKIYVTGEEGAKAYLVARGESVRLWDDKEPIFYEKEADSSGRASIKIFRYEQIESAADSQRNEAIKSLEDRVKALEQLVRKAAKNGKSNADDGAD